MRFCFRVCDFVSTYLYICTFVYVCMYTGARSSIVEHFVRMCVYGHCVYAVLYSGVHRRGVSETPFLKIIVATTKTSAKCCQAVLEDGLVLLLTFSVSGALYVVDSLRSLVCHFSTISASKMALPFDDVIMLYLNL